MARVSKITLAQKQITEYFNAIGKSAFSEKEITQLIEEKRDVWDLPATTYADRIILKLTDNGFLTRVELKLSDQSEHAIFLFGTPSIYEVAVALRPKSFISHFPAVFLHELTTQVPKTIYTTVEQSQKHQVRNNELEQEAIDRAFAAPQRRSNLSATYQDYTLVLLTGKFSNRSGVLLSSRYNSAFSLTNIERTLIDITVRPNYGGGSFAVLEAYRRATASNLISSNKFMAVLERMDFIYPYHQAIGFYLDKAGYEGKLLDRLKSIPLKNKFYLDYDMRTTAYDEHWKIWYPKGM